MSSAIIRPFSLYSWIIPELASHDGTAPSPGTLWVSSPALGRGNYFTTLGRTVATADLELRELVIIPMLNQPEGTRSEVVNPGMSGYLQKANNGESKG